MSLYNMMRGYNPFMPIMLKILNLVPSQIPRFRDAWFTHDGKLIVILTRTGGGNREEYADDNAALRKRPGFIHDVDDAFDSTFAHFLFEMPRGLQGDFAIIGTNLDAAGMTEDKYGPQGMIRILHEDFSAHFSEPQLEAIAEAMIRIERTFDGEADTG